MAFQPGYKSVLYLAGTQVLLDNVTHPQTVQTIETSVMGTVAKQFITGLIDGDQVSFSGPYDVSTHTLLTTLKAQQAAGSAAAAYIYGPGGSVASQARSAGSAWVASYQTSSGVGGRVEYSASIQTTGAISNSTF